MYVHTHTHLSKDWYSFSSIHSHFSVSSAPISCNTSHRLSCSPSSSTELALAHSCTTADEHEDAVRTKTGRERSRDLTSSSTACAPPHLRLQEHSTENFLKNLAYVHTQQYKVTIIQTCPLSYVHAYTTNVVQHYTISTAHAVALHELKRVLCYTKGICIPFFRSTTRPSTHRDCGLISCLLYVCMWSILFTIKDLKFKLLKLWHYAALRYEHFKWKLTKLSGVNVHRFLHALLGLTTNQ